jgi:hypothetical protein
MLSKRFGKIEHLEAKKDPVNGEDYVKYGAFIV